METPRLEMVGVAKRFGATVALDRVDLRVSPGEVHALIGENGAGKSTLMKILSGALRPDAGRLQLDGAPYAPRDPHAARRAGVAMIYQELALAPHLTVAGNIALGAEPARFGLLSARAMDEAARQALGELGHGDLPLDVPAGRLSIGLQQMVEIARALVLGCRVLVFDEPTSSLSQADIRVLFRLIGRLRERGLSIVYISHFLEEIKEVADRYTVLRDGRTVDSGRVADVTTRVLADRMVGRRLEELYPRSRHEPGEVLLELADLAGRVRPAEASLTVRRGEVLGIAGLVGAGRTELLRAVFGLDPVRRGRLRVAAWSGPASPARRWRQGVGLVSEDRAREGLAAAMSVADNLTLSRLPGALGGFLVLAGRQRRVAARWTEAMDIRCRDPGQRVADLSGGNQQKVALARLLYHDVDLFLLDEPTRGIDVGSKAQIYRWIDDLAAGRAPGGRRRAVLMVSSYVPELLGVCDRIAVMARGRLLPARPAADCASGDLMALAAGGQAA